MVVESERESLEKKMPLVIDRKDLSDVKYSYEKFDIKYYLDSYFQIVTGNNFTDFRESVTDGRSGLVTTNNSSAAFIQATTSSDRPAEESIKTISVRFFNFLISVLNLLYGVFLISFMKIEEGITFSFLCV